MKPAVFLTSGNPARILGDCKKAAVKADWSLAQWVEFSATARACLSPEAASEEWACFLRVVEERFDVTRGPRFNADPSSWSSAQHDFD